MGFVSRRVVKRPLLTLRHIHGRRAFYSRFGNWTATQWKKVIFSDEKLFRVRPGGLVKYWYQKTEKKFLAKYVVPTVQKPVGVMVWAAMDGHGRVVMKECPRSMDSRGYQGVLESAKSFIKRRYRLSVLLFTCY